MVESVYTTDLKSVGLTVLRVRVSPGAWLLKENIMEKEKCVNCKVETNIPVDRQIELRECYVEGVGQLCKDCWNKIYFDVRSWSVK